MTKARLTKNKNGKIVAKGASAAAKKRYAGSKLQVGPTPARRPGRNSAARASSHSGERPPPERPC